MQNHKNHLGVTTSRQKGKFSLRLYALLSGCGQAIRVTW